jgi:diaminopimelate epimerase
MGKTDKQINPFDSPRTKGRGSLRVDTERSRSINFTKIVGSGNDFVLVFAVHSKVDATNYRNLAKKMCDRKFGIGADGLLVLQKSKVADIKMRIFNADGSEAEMCGNGARCTAYWLALNGLANSMGMKIETKAGVFEAGVKEENVKLKFIEPKDIKMNIPLKISNRTIKVNFINTGVPHAVIFVEGLEKIAVDALGRAMRYHDKFKPAGTNVDFVEVLAKNSIKVRTYERGVETETLACGTGSVASAIITSVFLDTGNQKTKINVSTRGGEVLKVYFQKTGKTWSDVWLEGKAQIVYKGVYYV